MKVIVSCRNQQQQQQANDFMDAFKERNMLFQNIHLLFNEHKATKLLSDV
jgi:hypothetical protein